MKKYLIKIKNLSVQAKSALVLTISTFICKGINIISTPIFTRILSTYNMGIVTTYNSWYAILSVIANLNLDSGSFNIAMMQYRNDRDKYMSSILSLSFLSSTVALIIFIVFKDWLIEFLGLDPTLLILLIVSFYALPATNFWMMKQRYEYKYYSVAIVTLLSASFSIAFSVFCTLYNSTNATVNLATVRLISGNLVPIIIGSYFSLYIIRKGRVFFNKEYWKFVFRVNTPLLVHGLSKQLFDVSDRTMISQMVGKSEVGIYGVLYSVSSLSLIIWNSINASIIPFIFENIGKGINGINKIKKTVSNILLIYGICCFLLTLVAPEIVRILATEEYYEAIYLMPPIAAGIFFTSLYNLFSNILLYYEKTKSIMYATLTATVFNIGANYLLIPIYGYIVAAYTTLISYILLAFMQFFSLRVSKSTIPFDLKTIIMISLCVIIFCFVCIPLYQYSLLRWSIIIILFTVFVLFHKRILSFIKLALQQKKS